MGIFTWTDAQIKSPKRYPYGTYRAKDKLNYGSYGKIVCPDDSIYETVCYRGYGMFGSKDAYDAVVEWNREDLPEIFKKLSETKEFGYTLADIAKMYSEGVSDKEVTQEVKRRVEDGILSEYLISDWKRNIGIAIACEDDHNRSLKYPLKITTAKRQVHYTELFPSRWTQ